MKYLLSALLTIAVLAPVVLGEPQRLPQSTLGLLPQSTLDVAALKPAPKPCPCACGCDSKHKCKCDERKCLCSCGCAKSGKCVCDPHEEVDQPKGKKCCSCSEFCTCGCVEGYKCRCGNEASEGCEGGACQPTAPAYVPQYGPRPFATYFQGGGGMRGCSGGG